MTRQQRPSRGWWPEQWVGSPVRVILILLVGAGSLSSMTLGMSSQLGGNPFLAGTLVVITVAAFLLHPRQPEWAISTVALALSTAVFLPGLTESLEVAWAVCYSAYLASAYSSRTRRRVWLGWLLLGTNGALLTRFVNLDGPNTTTFETVLTITAAIGATCAVLGFFWMLGTRRRQRRDRLAQLAEQAQLAGVVERTRIAREMHDIIAHNLSGVIALADGARYAAEKEPQVAVETLATISATSRQALQQMRGLLSVLREDTGRTELSAPGRREIEALFADARRNGLELRLSGSEALPVDLPELVQFTIYRLIQEMLTNMLKYAEPRRGEVTMTSSEKLITLHASNPVLEHPLSLIPPAATSGYGLVGMRERVRAHGGRLHTEAARGKFSVTAEVPL
ncbi:sensor histidine kinase [Corynebacterium sp. A21]|uniref:sensor histidine kinase n=1 Tax=Corynebacterium sp. A21 TaxID=3457318 RepID=UPI003FD28F05